MDKSGIPQNSKQNAGKELDGNFYPVDVDSMSSESDETPLLEDISFREKSDEFSLKNASTNETSEVSLSKNNFYRLSSVDSLMLFDVKSNSRTPTPSDNKEKYLDTGHYSRHGNLESEGAYPKSISDVSHGKSALLDIPSEYKPEEESLLPKQTSFNDEIIDIRSSDMSSSADANKFANPALYMPSSAVPGDKFADPTPSNISSGFAGNESADTSSGTLSNADVDNESADSMSSHMLPYADAKNESTFPSSDMPSNTVSGNEFANATSTNVPSNAEAGNNFSDATSSNMPYSAVADNKSADLSLLDISSNAVAGQESADPASSGVHSYTDVDNESAHPISPDMPSNTVAIGKESADTTTSGMPSSADTENKSTDSSLSPISSNAYDNEYADPTLSGVHSVVDVGNDSAYPRSSDMISNTVVDNEYADITSLDVHSNTDTNNDYKKPMSSYITSNDEADKEYLDLATLLFGVTIDISSNAVAIQESADLKSSVHSNADAHNESACPTSSDTISNTITGNESANTTLLDVHSNVNTNNDYTDPISSYILSNDEADKEYLDLATLLFGVTIDISSSAVAIQESADPTSSGVHSDADVDNETAHPISSDMRSNTVAVSNESEDTTTSDMSSSAIADNKYTDFSMSHISSNACDNEYADPTISGIHSIADVGNDSAYPILSGISSNTVAADNKSACPTSSDEHSNADTNNDYTDPMSSDIHSNDEADKEYLDLATLLFGARIVDSLSDNLCCSSLADDGNNKEESNLCNDREISLNSKGNLKIIFGNMASKPQIRNPVSVESHSLGERNLENMLINYELKDVTLNSKMSTGFFSRNNLSFNDWANNTSREPETPVLAFDDINSPSDCNSFLDYYQSDDDLVRFCQQELAESKKNLKSDALKVENKDPIAGLVFSDKNCETPTSEIALKVAEETENPLILAATSSNFSILNELEYNLLKEVKNFFSENHTFGELTCTNDIITSRYFTDEFAQQHGLKVDDELVSNRNELEDEAAPMMESTEPVSYLRRLGKLLERRPFSTLMRLFKFYMSYNTY